LITDTRGFNMARIDPCKKANKVIRKVLNALNLNVLNLPRDWEKMLDKIKVEVKGVGADVDTAVSEMKRRLDRFVVRLNNFFTESNRILKNVTGTAAGDLGAAANVYVVTPTAHALGIGVVVAALLVGILFFVTFVGSIFMFFKMITNLGKSTGAAAGSVVNLVA
jgi:hypothetical protein